MEAYHLESQKADYPRIVVSQQIRDVIQEIRNTASSLVEIAIHESAIKELNRYLFNDQDGNLCVDYMGKRFFEYMNEATSQSPAIDLHTIVYKAYAHICDEEERFRNEGNNKLFERYARLRSYMDSRLDIWGWGNLTKGHW